MREVSFVVPASAGARGVSFRARRFLLTFPANYANVPMAIAMDLFVVSVAKVYPPRRAA